MLNPLYILMDLLNLSQSHIINHLETKKINKFADICIVYAKHNVDFGVIRRQAEETFLWWNPGYKD